LKSFVFIILLSLSVLGVSAQFPYLRAVNYPYQIPSKTIYDIFVDSKKQIWLGTENGLFRFNGKQGKTIPYQDTKQYDITYLREDTTHKIWGMNFANQIFYLEKDSLRLFRLPKELSLEGSLLKFSLADSSLWLLTHKQALALNLKNKKITFTLHLNEKNADFFDIAFFKGKIHIIASQKAYIIDQKGEIETWNTPFHQVCRFVQTSDLLLLASREDQSRKAAIFTGNQWKSLPDFDVPQGITIFHYKTTSDAKFWICTKQGGYLWDIHTGKTELLFPEKQFTGIVKDYQGSYWISTLEAGLWFCPSLSSLLYSPISESKLKNSYISGIYPTPQPETFWLTTTNGLIVESKLQNTILQRFWQSEFKKEITTLVFDAKQNALISSSGIFSLDSPHYQPASSPKSAQLYQHQYLLSAQSFTAEWATIYQKLKDTLEQIFGATLNSAKSKNFNYPIYTIRQQRAYSVCVDSLHQKFWIGFADDLYEYDFKGNSKIIRHQQQSILARSMCVDKHGNLYVATFTKGIFIIKNSQIAAYINEQNFLKSNICKQISNYQDTIWIGTEAEIGFLSPQGEYFYDVLGNNGIGKIRYQRFLPTNEYLLVATEASILALRRDKVLPISSLYLRTPTLSIKEDGVSIHLEALNYKSPEYNRLFYRLIELEKNWNEVNDIEFSANYLKLSPGKYTLAYYTQDVLSGAKSPVAKISFEIPKKWWQKAWATTLFVLFFLGAMGGLLWWALKRIEARQSLREALWISQLKAIKTQMNPHFLYNVLNTVQGLVYGNRKSEASDLLGNFSDLMRKMLESSEKPYISLKEELENLCLYLELEKIRFEDSSFSYQMQAQVPHLHDFLIPSMLLQPFVENAIKHGLLHKKGEKILAILVTEQDKALKISIEDNGIGRKQAQEIRQRQHKKSTQFANSAIEQRIDLINKMKKFKIDLKITDKENPAGEALGTNVEIIIQQT